MSPQTEKKILQAYLNLSESGEIRISVYQWIGRVLCAIAYLGIFAIYSGYTEGMFTTGQLVAIAAVTGAASPISFYFSQMARQTPVLARYLSTSAMAERVNEINMGHGDQTSATTQQSMTKAAPMKSLLSPIIFWVVLTILSTAAFHFLPTFGGKARVDVMLQDTAWSFAEPVPASAELMIQAVEKYHASIRAPFDKKALTETSPFNQLDIEYEYATQKPSGEWEHIPVVIRVGDGTQMLSYVEILWQLHSQAHAHLQDQDHRYFEGLAVKEKSVNTGVALYEVYLGS